MCLFHRFVFHYRRLIYLSGIDVFIAGTKIPWNAYQCEMCMTRKKKASDLKSLSPSSPPVHFPCSLLAHLPVLFLCSSCWMISLVHTRRYLVMLCVLLWMGYCDKWLHLRLRLPTDPTIYCCGSSCLLPVRSIWEDEREHITYKSGSKKSLSPKDNSFCPMKLGIAKINCTFAIRK